MNQSPDAKSLSPWRKTSKGRVPPADLRERARSNIVDKMLQIAGQPQKDRGSVNSYEDVKREQMKGEDGRYTKRKGDQEQSREESSFTKKASERSIKDRVSISKDERKRASPAESTKDLSDGKNSELFQARKRKFEAAAEVSVKTKTISLKGIIPVKKDRQKESKDESLQKKSKVSSNTRERNLPRGNKNEKHAKKTSNEAKNTNTEASKSAKITAIQRKSRESVKSVKKNDSDDSDDESSESSSLDDSESDSDEDAWRNKKSATSERNQDDIERERRKRLEAAREKEREEYRAQREERRKKEEEERKREEERRKDNEEQRRKDKEEQMRKEQEERKKAEVKKKDSEKIGKRERVRESSKSSRESKVRQHKKKRFIEMEGSDDEKEAVGNKSGPNTSIVLPTKKTENSASQRSSRGVVLQDSEEAEDVLQRKLSKTDARHLILSVNKSSQEDDGNREEEKEEDADDSATIPKKKGTSSPVVIFQYDTGK